MAAAAATTVRARLGMGRAAGQLRGFASERMHLPTGEWLRVEAATERAEGATDGSSTDEVIVRVGVSEENLVRLAPSPSSPQTALPSPRKGGEADGSLTALAGEQDSVGDIQRVEVVADVGCHVGTATAPDNNVLLRLHWEGFLVRGFPARTPSLDPSTTVNLFLASLHQPYPTVTLANHRGVRGADHGS